MKIGVIIETNNPEQAWNAVRFCNAALQRGHEVKIFLISAGVEIEGITDEKYNVSLQLEKFSQASGIVYACGTCLKSRNQEESGVCPMSTMNDCVDMVEWADKVISF